nr:hypothetical protein [Bartonella ancashensis]
METNSPSHSLHWINTDHAQLLERMITLIQDEIDDPMADYASQIQDSILAALRLCEQEILFFNEKREITLKTQPGKTWYGAEECPLIEKTMVLEAVLLEKKSAKKVQLFHQNAETLCATYGDDGRYGEDKKCENCTNPLQGIPIFYTFWKQKIGLFPTPHSVETVRLYWVPFYLGKAEGMQNVSPWFIYAFDLIKARAKYELYKNILKDPEYAAVSFNDFQEQLQILRIETSRRNGCEIVRSTGF